MVKSNSWYLRSAVRALDGVSDTWTSAAITRHLMGAIAMAVQRGNAIAMLSRYTRAARAHAAVAAENGAGEAREELSGGEKEGEENGMTDGRNKEHEDGQLVVECAVCCKMEKKHGMY